MKKIKKYLRGKWTHIKKAPRRYELMWEAIGLTLEKHYGDKEFKKVLQPPRSKLVVKKRVSFIYREPQQLTAPLCTLIL